MIKIRKIFFISLIILTVALPGSACTPPNPVDAITLFKVYPNQEVPTGSFAVGDSHPTAVEAICVPGDKIFIILCTPENFKGNITFTGFTFFNQQTHEEANIPIPEDLESFEPGQTDLIAFHNPWNVPSEPGIYELRVYVGNMNVASAVFEVK